MNSFFKRIFLLLTSVCFLSCVLESGDNFSSSAQTSASQASGSSFTATEKIYLNLSDATFSLDGETYTEISSANSSETSETANLVSFDSSETTLLNVDLSETAKNMGVYISGTNDSSKIGGIRIQTYYDDSDETNVEYYEVGVYLNGATITSTNYPCIFVTKGAPANIFLVKGTTNSLTDGRSYGTSYSEDQKGTLFSKGSIALCGEGTLNVKQAYKNCIASKGFLDIEGGTYTLQNYLSDSTKSSSTGKNGFYGDQGINVAGGSLTFNGYGIIGKSASSSLLYDVRKANAFKTDDDTYTSSYVKISGGTVNVSTYNGKAINAPLVEISGGTNVFSIDGITTYVAGSTSGKVSDADGTTSTDTISYKPQGIDANTVRISGGSTTISSIWSGINSNGVVNISGGTLSITTTGTGVYDSSDKDYTAPACIKADGNVIVSGGTVTGTASGNGSKGIKAGGTYTQSSGSVNVKATGSDLGSSSSSSGFGSSSSSSSSASSAAKGVRVAGAINISGGKFYASSTNNEAIESKSTITISGGEVYGNSTGDDAINSASTMTISGGYVCGYSSANDGLDANGNMYIKGGVIYAVCTTTPEVALDANTEGGYKLYISGGTLMALGPLESGASLTQSCYQASTWSANTNYGLTVGSTTYVFKTPSTTSGYGSGIVVSGSSTPSLTSGATTGGTSYFDGLVYVGGTKGSSSVSLSSYSASSSGGGGNSGGNSGGPGGGGSSGPGGR